VRDLQPGQVIQDPSLSGFGARRRAGDAVTYFLLYYTPEGRRRRYTIGVHGAPWTPDEARQKALELLAEAKVKGADPAAEKRERREAPTVAELCDLYLADAEGGRLLTRRGVAKKPSTLATDKGRIARHIKPVLGALKVKAVTRTDVERFMHAIAEGATAQRTKLAKKRALANVRGGKGTASRTIGLLGAIFTYAERKRMIDRNPVRGVVRYADGRRERRLSDEEYAALGRGLLVAEQPSGGGKANDAGMWPPAVAAARFLALTGWRSGEALTLRWSMIDLPRRMARLPDTKTGQSLRPLSAAVCRLLEAQRPGRAEPAPRHDGAEHPGTGRAARHSPLRPSAEGGGHFLRRRLHPLRGGAHRLRRLCLRPQPHRLHAHLGRLQHHRSVEGEARRDRGGAEARCGGRGRRDHAARHRARRAGQPGEGLSLLPGDALP
jgi:integrase